jgi:TIR domain
LHIVDEIPLVQFHDEYLSYIRSEGFKLLIMAVVREADAPEFYADILRYWSSLHDLTGPRVVFAVAGPQAASRTKQYQYVGNHESLLFAADPRSSPLMSPEMHEVMVDVRERRFNPRGDFHRRITPDELADANTLQISELRDHLGLDEQQLPCLHLTALTSRRETAVIEFRSFPRFSIYTACKDLVSALNGPLTTCTHLLTEARAPRLPLEDKLAALERDEQKVEVPVDERVSRTIATIRAGVAADHSQFQAVQDFLTHCEARLLFPDARATAHRLINTIKATQSVDKGIISAMQRLVDVVLDSDHVRRDPGDIAAARAALAARKASLRADLKAIEKRFSDAMANADLRLAAHLCEFAQSRSFSNVERQWDAFISYASPDRRLAERLFVAMEGSRRVFMDQFCLKAGDRWREQVPDIQSRSRATVALITEHSSQAHYQESEIERAINLHRTRKHRIFPVLTKKSAPIPFGLEQFQAIFCLTEPDIEVAAHAIRQRL